MVAQVGEAEVAFGGGVGGAVGEEQRWEIAQGREQDAGVGEEEVDGAGARGLRGGAGEELEGVLAS